MDFEIGSAGVFWAPLRFAGSQDPGTVKELRCPRCWSLDCPPGLVVGALDRWRERRGKLPYECRGCGKRFYRFVLGVRSLAPAASTMGQDARNSS